MNLEFREDDFSQNFDKLTTPLCDLQTPTQTNDQDDNHHLSPTPKEDHHPTPSERSERSLVDMIGAPLRPIGEVAEALVKVEEQAVNAVTGLFTGHSIPPRAQPEEATTMQPQEEESIHHGAGGPESPEERSDSSLPNSIDLQAYDATYLCHAALAARVKRGAATEEDLVACKDQRTLCDRTLEESTTELERLRRSIVTVRPGEETVTARDCEEEKYLSQQLAKCREDYWEARYKLGQCINERNANATLLKVTTDNIDTDGITSTESATVTNQPRNIRATSDTVLDTTTPVPPTVDFRPYTSENWYSDVNEKAIHFRKRGQILSSITYTHLVLDIDLEGIRSQGAQICDILKLQLEHDTSSMNRYLDDYIAQLKKECNTMTKEMDEIIHLWFDGAKKVRGGHSKRDQHFGDPGQEVSETRVRRQLVVLGIIGIIAVGTYLFSSASLASLSVSAGTNPVTVRTLQDHETRLQVEERSMHILNQTMAKMIEAEQVDRSNMQRMDLVMQIEHAFGQVRRQFDAIITGINHLHLGRLSIHLIDPERLTNLMGQLDSSLASVGLTLVARDAEAIFDSPMSYLMFANKTIRCFVHLPAHKKEELLDLLEYIPVPYPLGDDHFLHIKPEARFLALSKDTQTFQTLTEQDLTLCRDIGRPPITYCQNSNVVKRRGYQSCLYALFDRDSEEITKHCGVQVEPREDILVQVSHSDMILYHHDMNAASFHCEMHERRQDRVTFKGFKMIHLNAGCSVVTNKFKIHGATEIYIHSTVSTENREIDLDSFGFDEIKYYLAFSIHDLSLVGSKEGLKIKDIRALYRAETTKWMCTIGFSTAIVVLLVCCLGWYCKNRCMPGSTSGWSSKSCCCWRKTEVMAARYSQENESVEFQRNEGRRRSVRPHKPSAPDRDGVLNNLDDETAALDNPANMYNRFYPKDKQ